MDNLRALPKIRDSISYVYVEHRRIDRHEKSIAVWDESNGGYTPVPAAALCVLMLGPGTTITHAAIQALAENNCLVVWCGEENVRFYAFGTGGTRSAAPLLLQARLVSDENTRLEVVKRMYRMRFDEWPADSETLTIEQLRGLEGVRMRAAYAEASRRSGVDWDGRNYDRTDWNASSAVNRALSAANSCLYGLCQAALLATGYSPGIGFIHTGKQLSFVYDIADLYKTEVSIPVAFEVAAEAEGDPSLNVERTARLRCRDRFRQTRLLQRIVPDIKKLFGGKDLPTGDESAAPTDDTPDFDTEIALPGALWAPRSEGGSVQGGTSYGAGDENGPEEAISDGETDDDTSSFDTPAVSPFGPPSPTANRPSIEDLFIPAPPAASTMPSPRRKAPSRRAAGKAPMDAPPLSVQAAAEPPSPFGPDDGCEVPPWGNQPSPWDRVQQILDADKADRADRARREPQASEPPMSAESGTREES